MRNLKILWGLFSESSDYSLKNPLRILYRTLWGLFSEGMDDSLQNSFRILFVILWWFAIESFDDSFQNPLRNSGRIRNRSPGLLAGYKEQFKSELDKNSLKILFSREIFSKYVSPFSHKTLSANRTVYSQKENSYLISSHQFSVVVTSLVQYDSCTESYLLSEIENDNLKSLWSAFEFSLSFTVIYTTIIRIYDTGIESIL